MKSFFIIICVNDSCFLLYSSKQIGYQSLIPQSLFSHTASKLLGKDEKTYGDPEVQEAQKVSV